MWERQDIVVLFLSRMVRLAAYGSVGVILAIYLRAVGLSNNQLGLLLTLTLLGDSVISLLVTRWADRIGRRLMLISSCLLMILSGLVYGEVLRPSFGLLLVAATVGVLSPSGNEVGPFMALEQSILSELVAPASRTHVFAWYNLAGYAMTAVGALGAGGALTWAQRVYGISELDGYRLVFLQYGIIGGVLLLLFAALTEQVERPERRKKYMQDAKTHSDSTALRSSMFSTVSERDEEAGLREPLLMASSVIACGVEAAAAVNGAELEDLTGEQKPSPPSPPCKIPKAVLTHGFAPEVFLVVELPAAGCGDQDNNEDDGVCGDGGSALSNDDGVAGASSVEPAGHELEAAAAAVNSFPLTLNDWMTEEGSEWHGSDVDVDMATPRRPSLLPAFVDDDDEDDGADGVGSGSSRGCYSHGGDRALVVEKCMMTGRIVSVCANATGSAATGDNKGCVMGLSSRTLRIVVHLSVLFAADAFAGGLTTGTLLSYFFETKYGVSTIFLGGLLFGANLLAAVSSLLSGFVAARIGLIKTMVFTHLPSNVLMLLIPLMPNLRLATLLLLLRFSISQMDVAPRSSYVAGVVRPDERTAAMGIVNVARSVGAAFGPLLTGWLSQRGWFHWSFFLCGGIKIAYDLGLMWSFAHLEPEY